MSNSRLEKFIYAICGMDVDDLPTPLSRIETLWNCLITGEVPDFEPLSRNEKYLMAMLNDNVDGLPEPTSRSEKLLYKIATGETDLSDVPGYLSRYEELLKQLIENGGIGGTDFEYVLYTLNDSFSTLYSTAEAPVKSAILSGRTEVTGYSYNGYMLNNHGILSANGELTTVGTSGWSATDSLIKLESGEYYIEDDGTSGDGYTYVYFYTENGVYLNSKSRIDVGVANRFNIDELSYVKLARRKTPVNKLKIYRKDDLKLTSVKMPVLTTGGKNLFDIEKAENKYFTLDLNLVDVVDNSGVKTSDYIKVKPNTTYTFIQGGIDFTSAPHNVWFTYAFYKNKTGVVCDGYDKRQGGDAGVKQQLYHRITTPKDCEYLKVGARFLSYDNAWGMLVEGDYISSLTYEPYKSNILTVNEPVELRGIGDVRDTLDLLTGELTQRIGEVVLDGSEDWRGANVGSSGTFMRFYTIVQDAYLNEQGSDILCDRFTSISHKNWDTDIEGIHSKKTAIHINIPTSKLESNDVLGFKKWLSSNPVTVCYKLATESVKTVDLSDNHVYSYKDTTHYTCSSEEGSLLPTLAIEEGVKYKAIIKPSTKYSIVFNRTEVASGLTVDLGGVTANVVSVTTGKDIVQITTPPTLSHNYVIFKGLGNVIKDVQVIEGDVADDIEYFEGMVDVKNPIVINCNSPIIFGKGGRL